MSTLQYKCVRTSTFLFMGLKTRCRQLEYFTWWGVPNINMKHAIAYIVLWYGYGGPS